jgi:CBS domain-containing protein
LTPRYDLGVADRLLLSEVIGVPVVGPGEHRVGRTADLVVRLEHGASPVVIGVVLEEGGRDTFVPRSELSLIGSEALRLSVDRVGTKPFERRAREVLLGRDVRGRAVIDVTTAELVRVRDLVLSGHDADWLVAGIVPAPVPTLTGWLKGLFRAPAQAEEVAWTNVEPLMGHVPSAAHRLPLVRLSGLRPADIADIVEQASHEEGEEILTTVHGDSALEADVFEELNEEHQLEFLRERPDTEVAQVLANMGPDDAADLLLKIDQPRRRPVLDLLPEQKRRALLALLGYGAETAGGLMSTEFITVPDSATVTQALDLIRAPAEVPETLTDVFTVSGDRLTGSISLVRLVRADPTARVAEVMTQDPIAVYADADLPSVALQMADYNLAALAVVDTSGRITGVITYDDIIEALLRPEWRWRGRPAEARPGRVSGRTPAGRS